MKATRMIALLLVLTLALAACGDDGEATDDTSVDSTPETTSGETDGTPVELETITPGTLTVCTDAPYIPMEYEDPETGEYTGFDIELLRAVAGNLGLDLAVVNVGFDPITSGLALEAGDCDIAAASITILPERAENIAFTDGYFSADQSLLVLTDSGIESLADLAGQSLAVQTGTTGAEYAEENAPEGTEIVSFESPGDVFLALESGQVQGVLQDIVPNQEYANTHESAVIAETYQTDEEYGFAAAKEGSEDLIAAVNEQIAALQEDGTYDELYEQFFPQG